jgi:hypothetical protein
MTDYRMGRFDFVFSFHSFRQNNTRVNQIKVHFGHQIRNIDQIKDIKVFNYFILY